MPLSYQINTEHKMVMSYGEGIVTFSESQTHQDKLRSDPEFSPKFNQFMDLRQVTKMELSSDDLERLTAHSTFANDSHRAAVVSSDVVYGLSRMFQEFRNQEGETGIQIFRNLERALDWVDLTSSSYKKIVAAAAKKSAPLKLAS